MWFRPKLPWNCSFLAKTGVNLVESVEVGLNTTYDSQYRFCSHWLWTSFDFGIRLHQSAIMPTYDLGQSSPQIVHFLPNLGVSLVVNGGFEWKRHVRFPSQALWTLLMHQFWLWSASAAVCSHANMIFWPNQPWSCSFLTQNWGSVR